MADKDPKQATRIKIDYTMLHQAAKNMDDLRDNLDSQLSAWKQNITDSHMEGMTIYGGTFSGSGDDSLDQSLYDFYNSFTDIVHDAKTKMEKLSKTFRTVADQFLDNDLGLAASVNYQNYQYLLNAWTGKKSAYNHYLDTKDVSTSFQIYDENGNLKTITIPMWKPGDPVPTDPGAAPTSYTNTSDFHNPLFGDLVPDDKDKPYTAHAATMTTTVHLDDKTLQANSAGTPPAQDKQGSPVSQVDTKVTYDGGTYTESTKFTTGNIYDYHTDITHADGTTEVSTCTANPDGSNAVWTDTTKNTDGSTDFYKWTGNASKPADRVLVDSPAMKAAKKADSGQGSGSHGGAGRGLI